MDTGRERKHGSFRQFANNERARELSVRGAVDVGMDASFRPSLADRLRDSGAEGQVASLAIHAGLLFMFATAMATMGEDDREDIERDRIAIMRAYLDADADGEEARAVPAPDLLGKGKPGVGDPTKPSGKNGWGNKGDMGKRTATTQGHWSAKGSASKEDATIARARAREEAATFGIIGILAQHQADDANAPVAPWGSILNGADGENHIGNDWAPTIDDAFGDGLGLSGGGEGGGGKGEGIGLGHIGTLSHCGDYGCGSGTTGGYGQGIGRVGGTHVTKTPFVRCGGTIDPHNQKVHGGCATQVNGRLPPEVIQRIVRQNFGRFRLCYEQNLRMQPSLDGRVSVKFVIDRSGAVAVAQDAGSDLPDSATVACVVKAFAGLAFPPPEGGIVTVVYPIMFSPGD